MTNSINVRLYPKTIKRFWDVVEKLGLQRKLNYQRRIKSFDEGLNLVLDFLDEACKNV